ncbi:MAG: orotate phosphoribosyltransferase [Prevotellaceae bacterium]|jgi:orotate phosphoribosyltransferase|nr:orotate phosphoribosyltransferase [Prevotellaceae bacterium]
MNILEKAVATHLLNIQAVKLQVEEPFTWASGWLSPIYCDNRKTLSYPDVRTFIKNEFVRLIKEQYPQAECIAGVATGAIAIGALVADHLNLPFVYVRSAPKDHGLENLVEGYLKRKQKVVVIEDLISTGSSSLKAVEALQSAGAQALGMLAVFTYGFPKAAEKFAAAKINLTTLCNYNAIVAEALEQKYISENQIDILNRWREQPETWGK